MHREIEIINYIISYYRMSIKFTLFYMENENNLPNKGRMVEILFKFS
jgi:hypothetical protein